MHFKGVLCVLLYFLDIATFSVFSFLHPFQDRPSRDKPLGFTIAGGKESGFGIFVSKVKDILLHTGCRKLF